MIQFSKAATKFSTCRKTCLCTSLPKKFKGPRSYSYRKAAMGCRGSIAVTNHRLLVYITRGAKGVPVGRFVNVPYSDHRFPQLAFTADDRLRIHIPDLSQFGQSYSGDVTLALKVDNPQQVASTIQQHAANRYSAASQSQPQPPSLYHQQAQPQQYHQSYPQQQLQHTQLANQDAAFLPPAEHQYY
eukprot:TRINITY_DN67012_c9_g1_i2.p1 TRINITY_DN67012_c9_g1~~TRINITY_DN67012_c9_g1_i2.p1  ORF type:complete len:186 (+),score=7.67 TRINITY_DN67012_c9_g1_i2:81-638(+)